jgi:DNA-binding winged helix-turn-helix (wHTH) protein
MPALFATRPSPRLPPPASRLPPPASRLPPPASRLPSPLSPLPSPLSPLPSPPSSLSPFSAILTNMIYNFGDFTLDSRVGSLIGPEGTIALRRQAFRLLEVLLDHAPDLVDRDTLLDEAWGRTALSPNVLPQAISELRQALGDQAQSPHYIETLHRRGYRVICPVARLQDSPDSTSTVSSSAETKPGEAAISPTSPAITRLAFLGLAVCVVALVALSINWNRQTSEQRWLHNQALPEIRVLIEEDVTRAWRLAKAARDRVGNDPQLEQLWLDLTLPASFHSDPAGAEILVDSYQSTEQDWLSLGRTPIDEVRLPLAQLRLRVELEDHVPIEAAPSLLPVPAPLKLHRPEETPSGMVFVSGGPVTYYLERRELPDFWIDQHEVTNRQYLDFIEDNGYRRPEFWPDAVDQDGAKLDFDQLMALLIDATGLPGPSTWQLGTFPEGEENHPVNGISWFEAMAYANWSGKQLPTVFHWFRAAGLGTAQVANFSGIIEASNFSGRGTAAVGSLDGLGPYGTYDMAGNVREWCLNNSGPKRHSLGASYLDVNYQFRDINAFDPLHRTSGMGMRLMMQTTEMAADLAVEIEIAERLVNEPVDDATFSLYARMYDYDPVPLEAKVEEIDDSHRAWRRERVSFRAAYSDERVAVQIFLPRNSSPPYQTIVHWPGGDALLVGSSRDAGLIQIEPFLRTGRAVVYPVYQGTFERRQNLLPGPFTVRNLLIQQVQDLRRTIDYLETRDDIDLDHLAYHGISYGGTRAPYALATENRFRTAILVSAGLAPTQHLPPELHMPDFISRVTLPVLMINGRHDFNFPYETSQRPFFELLGTPPENKRLIALDWGHLPPGYTDVIRAMITWTDRWLGDVETH